MTDTPHTLHHEILDALGGPGCALCALVERGMRRYFSALTAEGVMDERLRAVIRAARGFCAAHGRMLRESRDALGSAIIHRDVLANLTRDLEAATPRPRSVRARISRAVRAGAEESPLGERESCPACAFQRQTERLYVDGLAQGLRDDALIAALRESAGLCQPHLRLALAQAPGEAAFERLRAAQLAAWGRLLDELDEFIRKQDHRFTREPSGPERDSWQRAIDLVSGRVSDT